MPSERERVLLVVVRVTGRLKNEQNRVVCGGYAYLQTTRSEPLWKLFLSPTMELELLNGITTPALIMRV